MHEQEKQARNLEAEATRLLAEAAKIESEDDGDNAKMARLVKEALALKDEAEKIRKKTHLPPRDIVAEHVEFFKKYSLISSEPAQKSQQEALERLKSLRPVSGTDPDFDYGRDAEGYGKHESMK